MIVFRQRAALLDEPLHRLHPRGIVAGLLGFVAQELGGEAVEAGDFLGLAVGVGEQAQALAQAQAGLVPIAEDAGLGVLHQLGLVLPGEVAQPGQRHGLRREMRGVVQYGERGGLLLPQALEGEGQRGAQGVGVAGEIGLRALRLAERVGGAAGLMCQGGAEFPQVADGGLAKAAADVPGGDLDGEGVPLQQGDDGPGGVEFSCGQGFAGFVGEQARPEREGIGLRQGIHGDDALGFQRSRELVALQPGGGQQVQPAVVHSQPGLAHGGVQGVELRLGDEAGVIHIVHHEEGGGGEALPPRLAGLEGAPVQLREHAAGGGGIVLGGDGLEAYAPAQGGDEGHGPRVPGERAARQASPGRAVAKRRLWTPCASALGRLKVLPVSNRQRRCGWATN